MAVPCCPRIPELEDCAEDVRLRHQLWTSVVAWAELTATWLGDRFEWLAPAAMEEQVGAYSRAVFKMERGLLPNKVRAGAQGGCGTGRGRQEGWWLGSGRATAGFVE